MNNKFKSKYLNRTQDWEIFIRHVINGENRKTLSLEYGVSNVTLTKSLTITRDLSYIMCKNIITNLKNPIHHCPMYIGKSVIDNIVSNLLLHRRSVEDTATLVGVDKTMVLRVINDIILSKTIMSLKSYNKIKGREY